MQGQQCCPRQCSTQTDMASAPRHIRLGRACSSSANIGRRPGAGSMNPLGDVTSPQSAKQCIDTWGGGSRPVCAEELQDSRLPTFPDHALIPSQQKTQENNFNGAPPKTRRNTRPRRLVCRKGFPPPVAFLENFCGGFSWLVGKRHLSTSMDTRSVSTMSIRRWQSSFAGATSHLRSQSPEIVEAATQVSVGLFCLSLLNRWSSKRLRV